MGKVKMTEEMLIKYRKHPRILEIRLILLYDLFEREFGYNGVVDLFTGLCIGFKREKYLLDSIINQRFDVKRKSKNDKIKWKQELLFMGMCYGETPYRVAKKYCNVTPSAFYTARTKHYYDPEQFITDEWLMSLDDECKIATSQMYRNEVKAFLEAIEGLSNVLNKWRGDDA